MNDPSSGASPPLVKASEDRLDSWKEIAAYLKRDVTTVQRWERREGMPVHRHVHDKLGSVYAFRTDLDAWTRSRNLRLARDEAGKELEPAVEETTTGSGTTKPGHRSVVWSFAAAGAVLAVGITVWAVARSDYFWHSPIADAQFQRVTDFDGTEQAAAVSRDGTFVAFQSDRDGPVDVWVTQVGTGQFHNLTRGKFEGLANPSVRGVGFSPDGTLVTFWARRDNGSRAGDISVWAVPVLGGQPRLYLEGVAEFDWSIDGFLVYHTPGPGDPMFVRDQSKRNDRQIFTSPPGLHGHFHVWSADGAHIYFVQGSVPDAMDIWRIRPTGGVAERITYHNSRVSHPVVLNQHTLMYLASDQDGAGPWLHSLDLERRVPHRVNSGVDRYTSLASSADGRRLVVTLASSTQTLWRLPISDTPVDTSAASRISLTTGGGFSPRLGPGYVLYVSSTGASDSIWKLEDGTATELWTGTGARVMGGPAVAPDGRRLAFSTEELGRTQLYAMNADGTDTRIVTESLDLRGTPAWAPDGQSITTAADDQGMPHLFSVSLDGRPPVRLMTEYAVDPVWSPDGDFVVYSGPDIGTTFPVKAVTADGHPYPLPNLVLTRGARSLRFLPGRRALVLLRGEIEHKNLWLIDLETGTERQLTNLDRNFNVRDFDVSADGRELVLDRVQEHSDVVLLDLPRND